MQIKETLCKTNTFKIKLKKKKKKVLERLRALFRNELVSNIIKREIKRERLEFINN